MQKESGVKKFFEKESSRFDNIYSHEKRPLHRLIDLLFHGTIQKRFEMVLEELAPLEKRRILDVGCGSGRYSVEFAVRGAERVLGIDFSENMIALAREYARARGADDRCEFLFADFLNYELKETFNAAVCIGFFEYIRDIQPLFDRIAGATSGDVIISFPKLWTLRTFPRMVRYRMRGCFLRFFTPPEIKTLVKNSTVPIQKYDVRHTDRDYLLVCSTK